MINLAAKIAAEKLLSEGVPTRYLHKEPIAQSRIVKRPHVHPLERVAAEPKDPPLEELDDVADQWVGKPFGAMNLPPKRLRDVQGSSMIMRKSVREYAHKWKALGGKIANPPPKKRGQKKEKIKMVDYTAKVYKAGQSTSSCKNQVSRFYCFIIQLLIMFYILGKYEFANGRTRQ